MLIFKTTLIWQKYGALVSDVLPVGCEVIQRVANSKGLSDEG